VQSAMALIAVALAVKYAHDSRRYPSSARLDEPDTAIAHATQLVDSKAGSGKTSIPAAKAQEEKAINDIAIRRVSAPSEGCKIDTNACPIVMESLARMVKEPRDFQWASKMEETIQAAVDVHGPGIYVTRNLECRTSTCILEVEVRVPGAFPEFESVITSSLRPNEMTISEPEYDPSGATFYVELMDFARR
jgi:hypothetical protein